MKKVVTLFMAMLLVFLFAACEPVETDKTDLTILIEQCQSVNPDDYTLDSYNNFAGKLNDAIAVRDNENVTQKQIDSAREKLSAAYDSLVTIPTTLEAFVETFNSVLSKTTATVTEEDKAAVEAAIAAFEALSDEEKAQLLQERALLDSLLERIRDLEVDVENNPTAALREAIRASDYRNLVIDFSGVSQAVSNAETMNISSSGTYEIAGDKIIIRYSHMRVNDMLLYTPTAQYAEIKNGSYRTFWFDEEAQEWTVIPLDIPMDSMTESYKFYFDYSAEDFNFSDGVYTMKADALEKYLERYLAVTSLVLDENLRLFGLYDNMNFEYLKIKIAGGVICEYEIKITFDYQFQTTHFTGNEIFKMTFSNYGNVTLNFPDID